jgi:predicted double-glycine peptidase
METAERFGLTCVFKEHAEYSDIEHWLTKNIPAVVDWMSPGRKDAPEGEMPDGHYSIVVGLDESHIYLQDPETGGLRTIPRDEFMRVWFDFKGARIEMPIEAHLETRVMIAVFPSSLQSSFHQSQTH